MKKNSMLLLALLAIALIALAACAQQATPAAQTAAPAAPTSAPAAATGDTIKIGALLDFTGPVADLGPKFRAGIELALEEANYKVAGRPIQLIVEDSATSVDVAVEKFKKLADKDQVKIIIGPLMGDAHNAIAPLAQEKKVLMTTLINGQWENTNKTYLMYPTTVDAQTFPFGKYVYEKLGYKTMVGIAADYAGKRGYADGVYKGFEAAGGKVLQKIYAPLGTPDYSPFISQLQKADVVMYALEGPGPVSRFIYQYRQAGNKGPMVTITQDGDYTPEALAELKDIALGIQGESTYSFKLDNPANKAFVAAITKKTGKWPSSEEQNAYVMAKVVLAGLEKTGGDVNVDKLFPAITSSKMDTPSGPLSWCKEGVAITDMYVTQAEKVGDKYEISAPVATVPQVVDSRCAVAK